MRLPIAWSPIHEWTLRGWRIAAVVFAVINVAGAVYAAAMGELPHALVHVALLVGGYFAWQLVPRKDDERQSMRRSATVVSSTFRNP